MSASIKSFKESWREVSPFLIFCVLVFSASDFMFGLDASLFGSLQALPSWLNTFGSENPKGADLTPVLPTLRKSIMNSIVYVGRLVGVLIFEPFAEKFGFKPLLVFLSVLQTIAVVLQLSAHEWIQFTVGRVISYITIGLIEACIPSYCAEIAPPSLRGFLSGLFVPLQNASAIWASGMCTAYSTETRKIGWLVPVAVQLAPACITLSLVWFTAESPRWLVSKGKTDAALSALRKLRRKDYSTSGQVEAEIELIARAIEDDKAVVGGRWIDLFSGSMWRRTLYTMVMFIVYEAGGNQFYNSYGPSFFVASGLGSKSFTYACLVQMAGTIGSLMTILLTDRVGRRPLCIFGSTLLVIWVTIIGALGSKSDITTNASAQNAVVASFVMLLWSTKLAFATHAFIVTIEMGGTRMRKKLMFVGALFDVLSSFAVSFASPYVVNVIGAKIGYVFTFISGCGLIFSIFFLPELRGRTLEEVDELFDKPRFRWGWQFKSAKTSVSQGVWTGDAEDVQDKPEEIYEAVDGEKKY
ncbi:hypothetical protein IAT38_004229 [Cryptococcus sp. DSM 104549]